MRLIHPPHAARSRPFRDIFRWQFALASLWVLGMVARPALACSCASLPPDEAFARATVVFVGEAEEVDSLWSRELERIAGQLLGWLVKSIDPRGLVVTFHLDEEPVRARFVVHEAFKGVEAGQVVELRTGLGHAECGFEFEQGKAYLVYGYGSEVVSTGSCSRNRLLEEAEEDLAYLRTRLTSDHLSCLVRRRLAQLVQPMPLYGQVANAEVS